MGQFLDNVRAFLRGSRSSYAIVPELFPPADIQHLRDAVRVRERAEEDGKNNLPRSESTGLDAVELDIRGRFEELRDRYLSDYHQQLKVYRERISRFHGMLDLHALDTTFRARLSDLKLESDVEANRLFSESQELKAMSVEVKNFRETNRLLHRLPHYTEHRWELWAWLAVLILAEFILNFLLLREAGTALTVIVQSLLYGLINVIFPFVFFSRWIRYKNHVNWRRALIGWCSVVLFLVYVIAVNLLMAHYRGVVLETAGDIATAQGFDVELLQRYWDSQRLAVERFATDPFGLTDIWSWFLFIGGCGLALAGLYKGYTSDDRYPGYGSLKRRYEEKYRRYVQGVEETCHTLKLRREDAVEEIGALSSRLEEEHRNLPQIVQSAVALRGRCRLALQRLDTDFQMLIREYRNINQTNRDTPPPDYFEDEATLGEVPLEEFQPGEIPSPNEAIDRLQGFSDELHEQFEQLVGKIESTRQVLDDNYPFMVQPVVGGA